MNGYLLDTNCVRRVLSKIPRQRNLISHLGLARSNQAYGT